MKKLNNIFGFPFLRAIVLAAVAFLPVQIAEVNATEDPPKSSPPSTTQPSDKNDEDRPPLGGPRARPRGPRDRQDDMDRPPHGRRRGGFRRGDLGMRERGEDDRPPPRDGEGPDGFGPGPGEGRPPHFGGRNRPGEDRRAPDPELIEEAMEVLHVELPQYHERLLKLQKLDAARFEMNIRKVLPLLREYIMLKERDPAMARTVIDEFKIEEQLRELSKEYRNEGIAEERAKEIESQIDQLVRKQVELQFQRRERRLAVLAERLAEEQQKLQEDRGDTESLVNKRIEQVKEGKFRGPPGSRPPGPGHGPPPGDRFGPGPDDRPPPPPDEEP